MARQLDEVKLLARMLEHRLGEAQLKIGEAEDQECEVAERLSSQGIRDVAFDPMKPFHEKALVDAGIYETKNQWRFRSDSESEDSGKGLDGDCVEDINSKAKKDYHAAPAALEGQEQ